MDDPEVELLDASLALLLDEIGDQAAANSVLAHTGGDPDRFDKAGLARDSVVIGLDRLFRRGDANSLAFTLHHCPLGGPELELPEFLALILNLLELSQERIR